MKELMNKKTGLSFLVTFLMGVFVHLTALTNRIFTADEYAKTILAWNNEVAVGRILLPFFQITTSTKYNVNSVCGIIALAFLAAAVELIFWIFNVEKTITKVIVAAVLVMSPCAFSTMAYPSSSTAYFMALFWHF